MMLMTLYTGFHARRTHQLAAATRVTKNSLMKGTSVSRLAVYPMCISVLTVLTVVKVVAMDQSRSASVVGEPSVRS